MAITDKRTRQAVGATAGFAVGAGASAAAGWTISKAVGALASTKTAGAIGSLAVRVAPRAVALLPGVGTVVGVGVAGYSLYQAVKPVVAHAQEARKKKAERKSNPDETIEQAQKRLGESFGGTPNDIRLAAENSREAMRKEKDQAKRDYHERRALLAEKAYRDATGIHIGPTKPSPAAPPAAPQQRSLTDDIKDFFKPVPNPEIEARRQGLYRARDIIEKQMAKGVDRGAGIKPETKAALDKNTKDLEVLAKEERAANPFKQGFQMGATVGATIAGLAAGTVWNGTKKLAKEAAAQSVEIAKLGKSAQQIASARPNSVIAGTPIGDKAKAIVNEAYARGGARPAFASPGYPASKETVRQVFDTAGKPSLGHYAVPALYASTGGAALVRSFYEPSEGAQMAERVIGGFEVGMAFSMTKALMTAPVLRPAASAVASIEALRNRVVRETATGRPAGVAIAKGKAALDQARIAAARGTGMASIRANAAVQGETIRAGGRVAASRIAGQQAAVRAGADLGVAKAKGAGRVARAENAAKLGPQKYKDTWMDSRGRTYHRKDMSVRSATNDNAARRRKSN